LAGLRIFLFSGIANKQELCYNIHIEHLKTNTRRMKSEIKQARKGKGITIFTVVLWIIENANGHKNENTWI
jgi:hypothetical protein